jgi:signal transduction histidine kinase
VTERVTVSVRESDGGVAVEVRDEGIGFDLAAASSGFGLVGMRERAELVDGTLAVDSTPGGGTTISIAVPARYLGDDPPAQRVAM